MRPLIKIATALIFVVSSLTAVHAQQGYYRLGYDFTTQKYTVYGKVTQGYNVPLSRFVNIFVTVVVPHGTGAAQFAPSALATDPALASANIVTVTRYNAPSENPTKDYLFFNFDVGSSNYTPINITANTEFPIFSFKNTTCSGAIYIMNMTTDPFKVPNLESINASNAFSILGAGGDTYTAVAGVAADCTPPTLTVNYPTTMQTNVPSTLTFTYTNATGNPAQAGLGFTYTLPAGVTVAPTPNATSTCGSPTFAPTAGGSSLSFSGGSMTSGSATCTVTVQIVATSTFTAGPTNVNTTTGASNNATNTTTTVTSSCTANAGVLGY